MNDLVEMRCPNCGAPFKVEGDSPTMECPFCGTVVMVPAELRRLARPETKPDDFPGPEEPASRPYTPARKKPIGTGCGALLVILLVLGAATALLDRNPETVANTGGPLVQDTATALPIRRALTAALPRRVDYGGFGIQVNQGIIDNRQEQNDRVIFLPDTAFARLDVALTNLTRESLFLDPQLFRLRLGNGNLYPLESGIILNRDFTAPEPNASSDVSFIFPVPYDAGWDGAALVVSDGAGEPAELPLTGDSPRPVYPVKLALPASSTVTASGITYQLTGASLDLDAGSMRAKKGTRFLLLDLHMTNPTGQYGVNISADNFRAIAGGSSTAPVDAPIAVIDFQSSLDGRVVFNIPAGAKTVQLQFGSVRDASSSYGVMTLALPGK